MHSRVQTPGSHPSTARSLRTPRAVLFELAIIGCLLRVYDLVREHADVRQQPAFAHGRDLLTIERWAGLDLERPLSRWTAAHRSLELVASHWYQLAHVTVTMGVLLWVWLRRPALYRWARTSLVLINLAGLAVFFLFPVAPPRLLPGSGVVDGAVSVGLDGVLGPVRADAYGALPSLHVGWAVWVAVVCLWALRDVRWRSVVVLYPVTTAVVVVLTGNHYLLDVPAGAAVAAAALSHRAVLRALARAVPCEGPRGGGGVSLGREPATSARVG